MKNNYLLITLCCFNIMIFTKPVAGFALNTTTGDIFSTNSFVPAKLFAFDVTHQDGKDLLKWDISVNPDLAQFQVESSNDDIHFLAVDSVYPKVIAGDVASYDFYSPYFLTGTRYYRLKIIYTNGYTEYSPTVTIDDATDNRVVVLYSSAKQFKLVTPYALHLINVVNSSGQILIRYNNIPAGSQIINLDNFAAGIYWIQCLGDKNEIIKIMNS